MVAVAAIIGSSYAATAISAGTWILTGTLVNQFLIRAAIGLALYALTPKPKKTSSTSRGYQTTQFGSAQPHQVVYGEARVGGVRVYDESTGTNNKFLHRVIAYTGHEIDSFSEIYIDDEVVTLDGSGNVTSPAKYNGFVRIKEHLGTTTQAADSDLVAESSLWTSAHQLKGISYLYARFSYDADVFPNGIPEITATVKGKKVYDPRTAATVWSDNPALCVRDYLLSSYGIQEVSADVDDDMFSLAADVCDDTATLDSSTRFTCNGSFLVDSTPYDILGQLLTSYGGLLWYAQGKWRTRAASWTPPSVSLDESDLRGNISVSPRHSRRDNFNTVNGTFRGSESNWQVTDFPPVTSAAYVSADGGDELEIDLDLPFTDTSVEARRIALIFLERNRQQVTISSRFGLKAFQLQIGDTVQVTNSRFGWTDKTFEVLSWTFGISEDLQPFVDMTLREISSSVFDEVDDGITYERDNTNLYDPFDVPSVGLAGNTVTTVVNERVQTSVNLTVTASRSAEIDLVEVQYKLSSDNDYIDVGTGELGLFKVIDIEEGDYDFRARAINTLGIKGDWTTLSSFTVSTAPISMSDVTGFSYNLADGAIVLFWDAVEDLGLSYYLLRHSVLESGASWSNSTTVVDKVPRPGTNITIPARPGTYLIRAVSKTGIESVNNTTVVVPEAALRDYSNKSTDTEDPGFTGTKTDTEVVSSSLRLTAADMGELLTQQNDLSHADWTRSNVTVSTDVDTPPGGSATADKVIPNGTSVTHRVTQNKTVNKNWIYRISCKAKADGYDYVGLNLNDGQFGAGSHYVFNVSDGTLVGTVSGTATLTNISITNLGSSWYELSVDMLCTTSGTTSAGFYVNETNHTASPGETYSGDTSSGVIFADMSCKPVYAIGEYEFTGYIDTSSVRRVRSRLDIDLIREDGGASLFDDIVGTWDSLAGNVDDLTNFTQVSDIDVKGYISTTDDDPSGSPTWSDWIKYQAGEFSGRAFKFKVELISKSPDLSVTPSITQLDGIVEYD